MLLSTRERRGHIKHHNVTALAFKLHMEFRVILRKEKHTLSILLLISLGGYFVVVGGGGVRFANKDQATRKGGEKMAATAMTAVIWPIQQLDR